MSESTTSPMQRDQSLEKPKDCLSCRLTGAATFSGLGIYALRQAQLQGTFQKIRPKGGSIIGGQVTAIIGIACITLGLGRLVM